MKRKKMDFSHNPRNFVISFFYFYRGHINSLTATMYFFLFLYARTHSVSAVFSRSLFLVAFFFYFKSMLWRMAIRSNSIKLLLCRQEWDKILLLSFYIRLIHNCIHQHASFTDLQNFLFDSSECRTHIHKKRLFFFLLYFCIFAFWLWHTRLMTNI